MRSWGFREEENEMYMYHIPYLGYHKISIDLTWALMVTEDKEPVLPHQTLHPSSPYTMSTERERKRRVNVNSASAGDIVDATVICLPLPLRAVCYSYNKMLLKSL